MLSAVVSAAIRRPRVCELANTMVALNNFFAGAKSLPAHHRRPNILFWQLMTPVYGFGDRIHAANISIAEPLVEMYHQTLLRMTNKPAKLCSGTFPNCNVSQIHSRSSDVEDRGSSRFQNSTPRCGIPAVRPSLRVGHFLGYSHALDLTLQDSNTFETADDEQEYVVSTIDVEPQLQP